MALEIPGWRDVLRLEDPRTLPPDEQLRRRREIAERIRQSPTPESARNVGSFLTYLDDIQDLISASLVLGVNVLGLVSRAHPVVRGAVTVAKAIDLAQIISPIRPLTRAPKLLWEAARYDDPFDNVSRLESDAFLARSANVVAQTLVVGQALETLFGVGLVLGPAVGFLSDLVFSTPLGVPLEYLYETIEPITNRALDVIRASPLGWIEGQVFTPQEHLQMAVGTQLAWQIAGPWIARNPVRQGLPHLTTRSVKLHRPRNAATLTVLSELGMHPAAPTRWPIPGEPEAIIWQNHARTLTDRARRTQAEIYAAWGDTPEGNLFFGTERKILQATIESTEPGRRALIQGLSPQARIIADLLDSPPTRDYGELAGLIARNWSRLVSLHEATGRPQPPRADKLEAIRASPAQAGRI